MLSRTAARRALTASRTLPLRNPTLSRRSLSTAPPAKKRSWKGTAFRWGLAGAGLYYYATSDVFAQEEEAAVECLETSIHKIAHEEVPTIDAVLREKRVRAAARAEDEKKKAKEARRAAAEVEQSLGDNGSETAADTAAVAQEATIDETSDATMDNLEEEAGQQGAFNPETGEINWDCPCLGGMAHGPCGPEFREAFSCFVYSNDEPKGMECIDKFKNMQDCFRQHPEIYGAELEDDEDEVEAELRARDAEQANGNGEAASSNKTTETVSESNALALSSVPKENAPPAEVPKYPLAGDESGDLIPKASWDAAQAGRPESK